MQFNDLDMDLIASRPRLSTYYEYATTPGRDGVAPVDRLAPEELSLPLEMRAQIAGVRLYFWDAHVSASLWPSIALVEVLVRNSMNDALCEYFQVTSEEGWHPLVRNGVSFIDNADEGARLKSRYVLLTERDYGAFSRKLSEIRRKNRGRSVSGDFFVAKSTLGTWVNLLNDGDSGPGRGHLHYEQTLWEPCLSSAFPHYNGRRSKLRSELNRLAKLRNRIAHHEHLLGRNLTAEFENIVRLASFVDKDVAGVIRTRNSFKHAFRDRDRFLAGNVVL